MIFNEKRINHGQISGFMEAGKLFCLFPALEMQEDAA